MKELFFYLAVVFFILSIATIYISQTSVAAIFLSMTVICGGIATIHSKLEEIEKKLSIIAPEEKKLEEK